MLILLLIFNQAAINPANHRIRNIFFNPYLLSATGKQFPEDGKTYDLFDKTIREPGRHPELLQRIKEVIGDVCVWREIYTPAALDETTLKDAHLMIEHVRRLRDFLKSIK